MAVTGRWPANVILSPGAALHLDEQPGIRDAGHFPRNGSTNDNRAVYGTFGGQCDAVDKRLDSGGASRFFLTAGYEPWELEWIIANGLTPCGT